MTEFLVAAGPDAAARCARVLASRRHLAATQAGSAVVLATDDLTVTTEGTRTWVVDGAADAASARRIAESLLDDGPTSLSSIDLPFSAVLWDHATSRLVAARDKVGLRGLWWAGDATTMVLASELRPISASLGREPDPDTGALAHWLAMLPIPDDRTLLSGIRRMPPATRFTWSGGAPSTIRYWAPSYLPPSDVGADEAAAMIREWLAVAVARALEGRGRVGVQLSGGLDSSSIAAVAAAGGWSPEGYSATFPEHPAADERTLIEQLLDHLGLPGILHEFREGSAIRTALAHIGRWGVPPETSNQFVWDPLYAEAKQHGIQVVLNGTGGDELFGAGAYLLSDLIRAGRLGQVRRMVNVSPGGRRSTRRRKLRFIRNVGLVGALPHGMHVRSGTRAPWLKQEIANDLHHDPWVWKTYDGPRWWANQIHRSLLATDAMGGTDHARRQALTAGVHPAYPLRDVELVERVLSLPPELAFHPERSRELLRSAMTPLLPDAIRLRREKARFNAIQAAALDDWDRPAIQTLLAEPEIGAYATSATLRFIADGRTGDDGPVSSQAAWRLIAAECWLRELRTPGWCDDALETLPLRRSRIDRRAVPSHLFPP